MQNHKIDDLRAHLFDAIEGLKNNTMDLETAKGISQVAQVIVNLSRLEVDFAKNVSGMGTGFFPIAAENEVKRLQGGVFAPSSQVQALDSKSVEESAVLKVSASQKEIIDYLIENGGECRIGIINGTRSQTIKNLETLEDRGIIECVVVPPELTISSEPIPLSVSQDCGTWKLVKNIRSRK